MHREGHEVNVKCVQRLRHKEGVQVRRNKENSADPLFQQHNGNAPSKPITFGVWTLWKIQDWLREKNVKTIYITPSSLWENAYIESFHGKLRDECLNREVFGSLWGAQVVIEQWRFYYNAERPHSSLGYQIASEFAGRTVGCSALRSGCALSPSRTTEQNIRPMAELYL